MNKLFVVLILVTGAHLFAQTETRERREITAEALAPAGVSVSRSIVKLQDFEAIVMTALRQEFPRLPGIFTSVHSCRLPEYGPVISITLQLPAFYFTRPVLQELERRQKLAEQQANRIRSEIDRAATILRLKAREAELVDRLDLDYGTKKKTKEVHAALETELEQVRKTIKELEPQIDNSQGTMRASAQDVPQQEEVNLEKMIHASHKQLIQKITASMKDILSQKAPSLSDIKEADKISITAHIRDSFISNRKRSIIFVLKGSDVEAYRRGELDLPGLKGRVLVKLEENE